MQIHTLDYFLDRYMDDYLLADIENIQKNIPAEGHGNAAYLMTAAICSGMELIGSLTTTLETIPGCEACQKPEQLRFKFPIDHYCAHYLARVDERYKPFGPVARELIRNGIAHSFATKGTIGITRKGDKEHHLTRMSDEKFLVINADCFFDDFKKSYLEYARPDIAANGPKRAQAMENYERMRAVKAAEIERTMNAVSSKLDSWPWVDKRVAYSPLSIDLIEEAGEIQVVS